jgi:dTDP-L-rhamnose 4-epimerase
MAKRVLITGGAGFIGSHLADRLLADGYEVRVLDNLSPQVHGALLASAPRPARARPAYLAPEVEMIVGDIRDPHTCRRALLGTSVVFHLAARVGVGQSMYEIADYTEVNNLGTARLLEALSQRPIERLVVASSMSVYGEGLYADGRGRPIATVKRSAEQCQRGDWEPHGEDGQVLDPLPTPESKPADVASVYALSKLDQERLCMIVGKAYGIETVALRFFNVYGPRQALSNPYTGVLAIFSARLLNRRPPLVNEDGLQRRDFINVHDVVEGCRLALQRPEAAGRIFNLGSGQSYTVRDIAARIAAVLGRPEIQPELTGRHRVGDIRHCFADIAQARDLLGFAPRISLDAGLHELAAWLQDQLAVDYVERARDELTQRGLAI